MHVKVLCLLAFLAIAASAIAEKKVICYYESWAKYRKGAGKYNINNINAELCTHVLYSFAGIKTDGSVKLLDDASDLTKFTSFIKNHNGVKAVLSIGGASEGSKKFSTVVSDASVRHRFVKNVVAFLEKYNFDGVDIDWEYPNQKGGRKSDKHNYVLLLKELKEAFAGKGLSLSAAVGAEASSASKSYLISQIAEYLDFINIMTYDFNGSWNDYTGVNSPLYHSSQDGSFERTLNINSSVHYWLSQGAPRSKVIVGLPFYGASFTLKSAKNHGLYAKASGPGKAAPYTGEAGTIGYNEMCMEIRNGGWEIINDEEQRVPYAYKGNQWVGYDDVTSIKEKAEYVRSMDLGGVMIWSIDTDDFNGACGAKHVLLSTRINDKMIEQEASSNQTAIIVFSKQWM